MPKTKIKLLEGYEKELLKSGLKKNGLIITIAGLSGSGKSSVVQMLMKMMPELKRVYVGGIFREKARKAGMTIEEYCASRPPEEDIDVDMETLRKSIPGNVIVDGHISGWVMGDWADFKIFVTCPIETRAKRVALRDGKSPDEATRDIERRDREDNKAYIKLYGINSLDMGIYDFIINNAGPMSELENGVNKIVEKIRANM